MTERMTLPMADTELILTVGGLETWLVYHENVELPAFAAFTLLDSADGRERLTRYYRGFLDLAAKWDTSLILESPTWRASRDWGRELGYSPPAIVEINRRGIELIAGLRAEYPDLEVTASGAIGPRSDAYRPATIDPIQSYEEYHAEQIAALADAGAESINALTLTNVAEATGIARAARRVGIPVVISFTLETDGCLPTGHTLREAIEFVDAATGAVPEYYMVNCAHPSHVAAALTDGPWRERLRGIRANASSKSHAELDATTILDDGDPHALGRELVALRRRLPELRVLGGCCGTDLRHVEALAEVCTARGSEFVRRVRERIPELVVGVLAFGMYGFLAFTLSHAFEAPTLV